MGYRVIRRILKFGVAFLPFPFLCVSILRSPLEAPWRKTILVSDPCVSRVRRVPTSKPRQKPALRQKFTRRPQPKTGPVAITIRRHPVLPYTPVDTWLFVTLDHQQPYGAEKAGVAPETGGAACAIFTKEVTNKGPGGHILNGRDLWKADPGDLWKSAYRN